LAPTIKLLSVTISCKGLISPHPLAQTSGAAERLLRRPLQREAIRQGDLLRQLPTHAGPRRRTGRRGRGRRAILQRLARRGQRLQVRDSNYLAGYTSPTWPLYTLRTHGIMVEMDLCTTLTRPTRPTSATRPPCPADTGTRL